MTHRNILALDASTDILSIAVAVGDDTYAFQANAGRRHSELLIDAIDRLLQSAGIGAGDLDLLACAQGPGSFTGIRIAFAALKGIAVARNIPTVTVPTPDCIAYPHRAWPGLVLPVIDARQSKFYSSIYKDGTRLSEYIDGNAQMVLSILKSLQNNPTIPILLTGPAAEMAYPLLEPHIKIQVDPFFCDGIAPNLLHIIRNNAILEVNDRGGCAPDKKGGGGFAPFYLRKSDAEMRDEANQHVGLASKADLTKVSGGHGTERRNGTNRQRC